MSGMVQKPHTRFQKYTHPLHTQQNGSDVGSGMAQATTGGWQGKLQKAGASDVWLYAVHGLWFFLAQSFTGQNAYYC